MKGFVVFVLLIVLSCFTLATDVVNLAQLEDTPEYVKNTTLSYGKVRTNVAFEIGVFFMFVFAIFAFWWVYHRILDKWLARKVK